MTYCLYMVQKDAEIEGCDYTIGCGEITMMLDAQNMEEARKEVERYFYDRDCDECDLSDAFIVEIKEDVLPVLRKLQKQNIEEEKAEYERLKKKYG